MSCYNCYKLFYIKAEEVPLRGKPDPRQFCSDHCKKAYGLANSMKCQLADCGKRFLKTEGEYVHGKWFCNDEHAEADP